METSNSNSKIQFKIGMVAPDGAGKTTLISTIGLEAQERLVTEPVEFLYVGIYTQKAIQRANAEFNTAINNPNNLFQVPKLQPTSSISEYQFAVTFPGTVQEIDYSILDYPGGMLGTSEFASYVMPFLMESSVLLVPIPADILMYWRDTKGLKGTFNTQCNAGANMILDCDNVIRAVRNWIDHKKRLGIPAQLFFVPIKCEKYFNDNGGYSDNHQKLHDAVLELYVEPLKMTAEEKQLIQTKIYYVDTYGIVELRNVEIKDYSGVMIPVSRFHYRHNLVRKRQTKNAFELLIDILKFQVENRLNAQQCESLKNVFDTLTELNRSMPNRQCVVQ